MNNGNAAEMSRDKLMKDVRAVLADAQDFLKASATQSGEKLSAARVKAEESLQVARARLDEIEKQLREQGRVAAKATDDYVRENPWTSIGIAAGVGVLLGLVLGRR